MCIIMQVQHFHAVWKGKVHISQRSFRRWRGKFYAGLLTSAPSTAATMSVAQHSNSRPHCSRVLFTGPRPSIYDEEKELDEPAPKSPRPIRLEAKVSAPEASRPVPRRARVPAPSTTFASRTQRWVQAPTHASMRAREKSERAAYWSIYLQYRRWARERRNNNKPPPPMDAVVKNAIKYHFKIHI